MPASYQRTFNRFEVKYLLPQAEIRSLLSELDGYLLPDPHGDGVWGYPVHSVYWDSADLTMFWEKIEGIKFRRKLRFRSYGDGEPFVEIKQRLDRTIQKRRARLPLDRMRSVFGWGRDPEPAADADIDDPIVAEAVLLRHSYRLEPRVAIRYRRRAFFGAYEPDLRLTFDTRVQYSTTRLEPAPPLETGKYLVDPRLAVMEIKFNERVPLWLLRLVARRGLSLVRLSKYCGAVDREFFGSELT
ncbi:MAG: VTC domain-containing protein [Gemmatimonadota bacterium]